MVEPLRYEVVIEAGYWVDVVSKYLVSSIIRGQRVHLGTDLSHFAGKELSYVWPSAPDSFVINNDTNLTEFTYGINLNGIHYSVYVCAMFDYKRVPTNDSVGTVLDLMDLSEDLTILVTNPNI